MNIRSTDFKSVVSAYSTIPAELLYCTYWHSFPLLSVTFQNFWRDVRRDADDSGLYQFAGTPVKSRVSEKQRRSPSRDFKSLASAYSAMPALLHAPSCPWGHRAMEMDGGGFEPPKQFAADLQSVPFGHSGIHPCLKNAASF